MQRASVQCVAGGLLEDLSRPQKDVILHILGLTGTQIELGNILRKIARCLPLLHFINSFMTQHTLEPFSILGRRTGVGVFWYNLEYEISPHTGYWT